MSELDANAASHRKLDIGISKLPYNLVELPERYAETFRKAGARTCYTFRDNKLVPTMYRYQKAQSFADHATQWELLNSTIVHGDGAGAAFPLVSDDGTVIGHFGSFDSRDFYITDDTKDLAALVETGNIFVDRQPGHRRAGKPTQQEAFNDFAWKARKLGHNLSGYKSYNRASQTVFTVLTDPDGFVVQLIGSRNTDGIIPVYYSPLDLIAIPRLFYLMGRSMAKKVILAIARRRAKRDAARGTVRELNAGGSSAVDWSKHIQANPPAVKLGKMGEPGNLFAMVHTFDERVIYEVTAIVLRGEGDDAVIQLARGAHREMIRRAALEAQKQGKREFVMLGKNANANFQRHADDLARKIGIPGSGKRIPGGTLGDYEVTLDVGKALK
jgi:hypothetical protein